MSEKGPLITIIGPFWGCHAPPAPPLIAALIRSIDQIITDKIAPADVTSIDEESEVEEEDDTTPILPVVNALDYVNELRRLVASFDDADESLNHLNKIENFLYAKNIKNMKQRKIDDFLK
ncbi:unnamed protein product [Macrosiphum euphorbiae]|uniref:Uncharacterized protein n=1 Tax=Macrosiphum euphorbiae TaxID=13131 RepID=A0AAV0X4P7_9HEMI|nr:unnamed protein product [Macrosiphum euphorbiae]